MKRVILCEGKTDAILLSYFLIKCYGWSYLKKPPIKLPVANAQNEELNWYQHAQRKGQHQELAIWGVGGITQIPDKLKIVVERNCRELNPDNRFERLVLLFDHDDSSEICLKKARRWVADSGVVLSNTLAFGKWTRAEFELKSTPAAKAQLHVLPLVLPPDNSGALETFLIASLKQLSEHDKQLAIAAENFIGNLPNLPKRTYLNHRRLPDKACLGTILAVFSPDRIFKRIDKQLADIPWEQLESVAAVYGKLQAL